MVKKKALFEKFKSKKKSNPLPHRKKFHDFYFEERKKNPQLLLHIGYLSSYQTLLSVYLTKNNNKWINKHTKNNRKTPFTWYTVCFFGHYTTIPYLQSPISQVFSTILYYSPEKKLMFWPKRNKKTNLIQIKNRNQIQIKSLKGRTINW